MCLDLLFAPVSQLILLSLINRLVNILPNVIFLNSRSGITYILQNGIIRSMTIIASVCFCHYIYIYICANTLGPSSNYSFNPRMDIERHTRHNTLLIVSISCCQSPLHQYQPDTQLSTFARCYVYRGFLSSGAVQGFVVKQAK